MNPVAIAFGNNVRLSRERANLSQERLGLAAGLHRTEIGLLERGERVPRIDTLLKVAAALSARPEALLDGVDWRPANVQPGAFGVDRMASEARNDGA